MSEQRNGALGISEGTQVAERQNVYENGQIQVMVVGISYVRIRREAPHVASPVIVRTLQFAIRLMNADYFAHTVTATGRPQHWYHIYGSFQAVCRDRLDGLCSRLVARRSVVVRVTLTRS